MKNINNIEIKISNDLVDYKESLKIMEKRVNDINLNNKKALITGITGQDGSYMDEYLLEKGYEVHGIIRRSSSFNTWRVNHLYKDIH